MYQPTKACILLKSGATECLGCFLHVVIIPLQSNRIKFTYIAGVITCLWHYLILSQCNRHGCHPRKSKNQNMWIDLLVEFFSLLLHQSLPNGSSSFPKLLFSKWLKSSLRLVDHVHNCYHTHLNPSYLSDWVGSSVSSRVPSFSWFPFKTSLSLRLFPIWFKEANTCHKYKYVSLHTHLNPSYLSEHIIQSARVSLSIISYPGWK